jgi:hypothetical protein
MQLSIKNKTHLTHMSSQTRNQSTIYRTRRRPPPLGTDETKFIQAVAGSLLYYARAVDSTILPSLSSLATEQAKPTTKTKKTVMQLLDYLATQEEAILTYNASNMILQVHTDAGYRIRK